MRLRAAESLWKIDQQTNVALRVVVAELNDWSKDANALLGLASDGNSQSRQQVAAEVLGEIGPTAKEAVPLLQMMMRSSFEEQRVPAAKALQRIAP